MLKFSLVFAAIAFAGCASERLYVNVIDNEGNPISNATVHVGFTSGHVVFAEGKSCDYEARTPDRTSERLANTARVSEAVSEGSKFIDTVAFIQ